jgi:hypothetical protein
MSAPRMRDWLFHLDHLQTGLWSEPRCSVCQLADKSAGFRKQAEIPAGKKQKKEMANA